MRLLLHGKNAIIYGAGGGIGAGVARTFAQEGARVFLVGRTRAALDAVATDIVAAGGLAEVAQLDALDEQAVAEHARRVAGEAGSIDVSINLISRGDVQGIPLIEMSAADFAQPVMAGLMTNFLTARAAAQVMVGQGSGVILMLTSGSAAVVDPRGFLMGSTGPADAAIETFMRYLAAEVGPAGVRVLGLHTAGVTETLLRSQAETSYSDIYPVELERRIAELATLRRTPRLVQVAEVAAFLASDAAGAITGTITNVTCGLVPV